MEQKKDTTKSSLAFLAVFGVIAILFISLHYSAVAAQNPNEDLLTLVMSAFTSAAETPLNFKGATVAGTISAAFFLGIIYALGVAYYFSEQKSNEHYDARKAQGSAKFNTEYKRFQKNFAINDKNGKPTEQNMILAKDLYFGLKEGDNVNVAVIGSAGSGKSFGVIKPNLLQMNTSFVITDPSGEIFRAEAKLLLENGYNVKIFSTSSMANSNVYNPFDYVYDEDGNVDETRVTSMVSMFMANADDLKKNGKGDPFWDKSSKALLIACAMLLLDFYPPETHNMYHMLKLVQKGKVSESKSDDTTELGRIFEAARKKNPDSHCFSSYDTFTLAPARTANSILISAAVDLNMFNQTKVRNMTSTAYQVKVKNLEGKIMAYAQDDKGRLIRTDQNIDIRTVGDEKTAIFVNIPQADGTFNFLVSMMYSQLFESLYGRAEKICPKKWMILGKDKMPLITMLDSEEDAKKVANLYANAKVIEEKEQNLPVYYIYNPDGTEYTHPGYNDGYLKKVYSTEIAQKYIDACKEPSIMRGKGRLPWHVQCLLDEFANIGQIPEFPEKLATMRKYEISCFIVLQSRAQLENRYDKDWTGIMSNCDTTIFLGTSDYDTCKYISERLGTQTVRVVTRGSSNSGKGKSGSKNESFQKRELMTPDEVSRIKKDECIVLSKNGGNPFFAKKFKASDHKNWKKTGDVDPTMRIEPTEYTECEEKSMSKAMEQRNLTEAAIQAASGVRADGSQSVTIKTMNSPKDLDQAIKTSGNSKRRPIGASSRGEAYIAGEEPIPKGTGAA